jgi:hypothetical protein
MRARVVASSPSRTDPCTCASTYSPIARPSRSGRTRGAGIRGQQAHEAGDTELRGPEVQPARGELVKEPGEHPA